MRRIKYILIILLLISVRIASAQGPIFTQFYASPTLVNPAFAGTAGQTRFVSAYRNQWAGINNGFVTYSAAVDKQFSQLKSGMGMHVLRDKAGSGGLGYTKATFQYAYEVQVGKRAFFRPALEMSYVQSNLNTNSLVFHDQLLQQNALDGNTVVGGFEGSAPQQRTINIGTGFLASNDFSWLGMSLKNLNNPIPVFVEEELVLGTRLSVQGGHRFRIMGFTYQPENKKDLVVAFNFQKEGEFRQLDFGWYFEPKNITIGIWYRGLPLFKNTAGSINQDAVAILAGYHKNDFRIGYSYDITLSKLGLRQTAGSHELTLSYQFPRKAKRFKASKPSGIPCPVF